MPVTQTVCVSISTTRRVQVSTGATTIAGCRVYTERTRFFLSTVRSISHDSV